MIYPVYSANAIAMAAARGPLFERSAVDDREATTSGCEFASTLFLVPRQGLAICLPCLSGRAQAYSAGGVGPKDALCASLSSNESIAQTFLTSEENAIVWASPSVRRGDRLVINLMVTYCLSRVPLCLEHEAVKTLEVTSRPRHPSGSGIVVPLKERNWRNMQRLRDEFLPNLNGLLSEVQGRLRTRNRWPELSLDSSGRRVLVHHQNGGMEEFRVDCKCQTMFLTSLQGDTKGRRVTCLADMVRGRRDEAFERKTPVDDALSIMRGLPWADACHNSSSNPSHMPTKEQAAELVHTGKMETLLEALLTNCHAESESSCVQEAVVRATQADPHACCPLIARLLSERLIMAADDWPKRRSECERILGALLSLQSYLHVLPKDGWNQLLHALIKLHNRTLAPRSSHLEDVCRIDGVGIEAGSRSSDEDEVNSPQTPNTKTLPVTSINGQAEHRATSPFNLSLPETPLPGSLEDAANGSGELQQRTIEVPKSGRVTPVPMLPLQSDRQSKTEELTRASRRLAQRSVKRRKGNEEEYAENKAQRLAERLGQATVVAQMSTMMLDERYAEEHVDESCVLEDNTGRVEKTKDKDEDEPPSLESTVAVEKPSEAIEANASSANGDEGGQDSFPSFRQKLVDCIVGLLSWQQCIQKDVADTLLRESFRASHILHTGDDYLEERSITSLQSLLHTKIEGLSTSSELHGVMLGTALSKWRSNTREDLVFLADAMYAASLWVRTFRSKTLAASLLRMFKHHSLSARISGISKPLSDTASLAVHHHALELLLVAFAVLLEANDTGENDSEDINALPTGSELSQWASFFLETLFSSDAYGEQSNLSKMKRSLRQCFLERLEELFRLPAKDCYESADHILLEEISQLLMVRDSPFQSFVSTPPFPSTSPESDPDGDYARGVKVALEFHARHGDFFRGRDQDAKDWVRAHFVALATASLAVIEHSVEPEDAYANALAKKHLSALVSLSAVYVARGEFACLRVMHFLLAEITPKAELHFRQDQEGTTLVSSELTSNAERTHGIVSTSQAGTARQNVTKAEANERDSSALAISLSNGEGQANKVPPLSLSGLRSGCPSDALAYQSEEAANENAASDASCGQDQSKESDMRNATEDDCQNPNETSFVGDLVEDVQTLENMERCVSGESQRGLIVSENSRSEHQQRLHNAFTFPSGSGEIIPRLALGGISRSDHFASERRDAISGTATSMRSGANAGGLRLGLKGQRGVKLTEERSLISDSQECRELALRVMLLLLLTEEGMLDPRYSSQYPLQAGMPNVLFALTVHFTHEEAEICDRLTQWAQRIGGGLRVLNKLLSVRAGDDYRFGEGSRIGTGAYAGVFAVKVHDGEEGRKGMPEEVAVKRIDLPQTMYDRCVWRDVHEEVRVLDALQSSGRVCKLFDFGIDRSAIFLVMARYECSLCEWRHSHGPGKPEANLLRLYLRVYRDALEAISAVHAMGFVHNDVKADNFFLEAANPDGHGVARFPESEKPNFRVVLGDFGEATSLANGTPVQNRGTEYVKPPEMLAFAASDNTHNGFDRRRFNCMSGASADAWASGCLLYEVLTGSMLFYDPDWISFFLRLTRSPFDMLPSAKMEGLRQIHPPVVHFLESVLVQDPARRPEINRIKWLFDKMLGDSDGEIILSHKPSGHNYP